MSLRVWLPLTKDLRNQGLDEVEIINYGATFNSEGKLGGCYYFDGTDDRIVINGLTLPNIWSYSCWIYSATSSRGWQAVIMLNSTGGDADLQLGFYTYPAGNRIQNTANGQYNSGISWTYGIWHHFCGTFDGNNLKTYIDGILVNTKNITASLLTRSHLTVGARCNNSTNTSASNFFQGKLNDVRIYDHTLSPLEVKEISKGLILHYPLSDAYVEATINLITTEDCLSSTCYNGATSKYNYGTTTDMYKTVTTYDGRKGTKVYMGTNGNAAFPYVYINNMFTSDGTNSPAYKTLSFDYYTNIGTSIRPYRLGNGSGTATYRITNKNGIATGTGIDAVSIPVVTNGWNHIEITFHGTAAADSQWGYIQNYPSHTSNTNNFWFFANMQLETKDHATGYAGVGGTRNSNMIYDCSGFCNNGTISGALTISNDTSKYNVSTIFTEGCSVSTINNLSNPCSEFTIAGWVNLMDGYVKNNGCHLVSFGGTYCRICISKDGLAVRVLLTNGSTNYMGGSTLKDSALTANKWNYFVITFKSGVIKIYINGLLDADLTATITQVNFPSSNISIGQYSSEKPNAKVSDVRIYATALSADDIKSLYNNSAYIDNQGNIYGAVYEEV